VRHAIHVTAGNEGGGRGRLTYVVQGKKTPQGKGESKEEVRRRQGLEWREEGTPIKRRGTQIKRRGIPPKNLFSKLDDRP